MYSPNPLSHVLETLTEYLSYYVSQILTNLHFASFSIKPLYGPIIFFVFCFVIQVDSVPVVIEA
jgi:hypothetical protein